MQFLLSFWFAFATGFLPGTTFEKKPQDGLPSLDMWVEQDGQRLEASGVVALKPKEFQLVFNIEEKQTIGVFATFSDTSSSSAKFVLTYDMGNGLAENAIVGKGETDLSMGDSVKCCWFYEPPEFNRFHSIRPLGGKKVEARRRISYLIHSGGTGKSREMLLTKLKKPLHLRIARIGDKSELKTEIRSFALKFE